MTSWSGLVGFGPMATQGLSRNPMDRLPRSRPKRSGVSPVVRTRLRAVGILRTHVWPPSSDAASAMDETSELMAMGPTTKSSEPIEMDVMYTLPERSKASDGSPPEKVSPSTYGDWNGPSQVSPPS